MRYIFDLLALLKNVIHSLSVDSVDILYLTGYTPAMNPAFSNRNNYLSLIISIEMAG